MSPRKIPQTPVPREVLDGAIRSLGVADISRATIREIKSVAARAEAESGVEYIKMEMGVPGLAPSAIGVEAEIAALRAGVAGVYPDMEGLPELKRQTSRFIEAFVGIDIAPAGCLPVVGAMQGTFAAFQLCGQCDPTRDTILFIDPGFNVQKIQIAVQGLRSESFDVYDYRGERLRSKLESFLQRGNVAALIYSNPNNPSWICLKEEELRIIGELCTKYDVIPIEDMAYFAMDFRTELGSPFRAPYQPTVARYCDDYILLVSGSKVFSYAGQRIGVACISDSLFARRYPALEERYGSGSFGTLFIHRILYALSAGVAHSAQYALAAMFGAAADGRYAFLEDVKEYGRRASRLKEIFLRNGFRLVYDSDMGDPVADGFYFTIAWPGMSGGELSSELLYYGVSAIPLDSTGSTQQGLRVCTSFIAPHQYEQLDSRLAMFRRDHIKDQG